MTILLFILVVTVLILFSAVCSGLNIALMSLNVNQLKNKVLLGNLKAIRVYPFRENTHLTLAAILLTNVAFASATALVLGSKLNGFLAVAISTLLLVVFAELLPQAMFAKRALDISYFFYPFLKLIVFVTYPIAKPLQLLMDKLFGDHNGKELHTRHELALMIHEHLGEKESELDEDEVEIIKGALVLSEKHVSEIMTPIGDVFWLTNDTILDSKRISKIKEVSRSRIPVFNKELTACNGILLMKDLVDIDFDKKPYKVSDFNLHKTKLVGGRTALDTMFRKFISARTHMIPIERNDQIIGVITIEDLIEEIIGHEIIDESDHVTSRK